MDPAYHRKNRLGQAARNLREIADAVDEEVSSQENELHRQVRIQMLARKLRGITDRIEKDG